jgi:RimJ/RimL family protein N-acetyltransferase
MSFKIEGQLINLRPIVLTDIKDYERWNNPDMKAWQYDGPWYDDDLSALIAGRKKWIEEGCKTPYITEVGINIVEDTLWSKGLGTEAFFLWIDYLFTERELTRIGFTTWEGNKRMIRVGEKLGFLEEANIRKSCFVNGVFYDRIKMGILRDEWELKKKHTG